MAAGRGLRNRSRFGSQKRRGADACTPYEWANKPQEIFMDRAMLQKVSDRWNEYGFSGASPVADMIGRLTRPEVKKK